MQYAKTTLLLDNGLAMFARALNGDSTEGGDAICRKDRKLSAHNDMLEICKYQTLAHLAREVETCRRLGTEMLEV